MKEYKAIVMSIKAVDDLIEAALDINGNVTRYGDSLYYRVKCKNKEELEKFQIRMGYKATHWNDSSDIPETTAKELLAERLGANIERVLIDGDEQIILCTLE